MRTKLLLMVILIALSALAVAAVAAAGGDRSRTAEATAGTARFHKLSKAEAAGYAEFRDAAGIACIALPGTGAMGVHFVKGDFVGTMVDGIFVPDTVLDPASPEALVYEPRPNGKLKLVAHEYIVFQAAWDATHAERPSLFGEEFRLTESPNRFGLPAFYALHAWLWKPNPSGLFASWNPRVDC